MTPGKSEEDAYRFGQESPVFFTMIIVLSSYFHSPWVLIKTVNSIFSIMVSPLPPDDDGITQEVVRVLAWLKKRGANQRLIYCTKKWERKGIRLREICRGPAHGKMRVQSDPSTGEKWVVLDDLVWADNLMMEFGEEIPHHSQWTEL